MPPHSLMPSWFCSLSMHACESATAARSRTASGLPGASSPTSAMTPPRLLTYSLFGPLPEHRRASACAASTCSAAEPPGASRLTSAATRARALPFAIVAASPHLPHTGRANQAARRARHACALWNRLQADRLGHAQFLEEGSERQRVNRPCITTARLAQGRQPLALQAVKSARRARLGGHQSSDQLHAEASLHALCMPALLHVQEMAHKKAAAASKAPLTPSQDQGS